MENRSVTVKIPKNTEKMMDTKNKEKKRKKGLKNQEKIKGMKYIQAIPSLIISK